VIGGAQAWLDEDLVPARLEDGGEVSQREVLLLLGAQQQDPQCRRPIVL
jgi:hypothetical protein